MTKRQIYARRYSQKQIAKDCQKRYRIKMRKAAIQTLGGYCVRCGFSDERALQIDHVNGDGHIDRKTNSNGVFNRRVINSFLANENVYQLLCANCNWIKKVENNENRPPFLPN